MSDPQSSRVAEYSHNKKTAIANKRHNGSEESSPLSPTVGISTSMIMHKLKASSITSARWTVFM